jgi:zinc/manganese transport system permease protein
MNLDAASLGLLAPAMIAALLITATLVPLGIQVIGRGIVFIDLAIAQIAGLGVIVADTLGWEPQGWAMQAFALSAALCAALLLTWTERRWAEVQEAIIGASFVLASSAAVLLLANNPHGGEHLKDLLVGQILWVNPKRLWIDAIVYALIIGLWFTLSERIGRVGFYVLFACAVTVSVQLVGLYLVFATLVIPALATFYTHRRRLAKAYGVGLLGYSGGLAVSALADLPSGPMIVCAMAVAGIGMAFTSKRLGTA